MVVDRECTCERNVGFVCLEPSAMAYCKCTSDEASSLRDIGEPPPLTRIDKRRPSSRSPDSVLNSARTSTGQWRVHPEKRPSRDDVGWPSKKAYSIPHQAPLLAKYRNESDVCSPVERYENDENRMNIQQVVAATNEHRGNSESNSLRLYSRMSLSGKYYPEYGQPTMTIVPAICHSASGSFPHQYTSMNSKYVPDHPCQPECQTDAIGRRRNSFNQRPQTNSEMGQDPANAAKARAGDHAREIGVAGAQWACVRSAMQADWRPWLPTAGYKVVSPNGVVPILAQPPAAPHIPKPEEYQQRSSDMEIPFNRDKGKISAHMKNEQNGELAKAKGLTPAEPEIDLPLKTLCQSVLVEGRANEEEVSTLTAILLQAIDLARQSAGNRRGGNGGSHVITSTGSWERLNGERGDKQFAVAVHGPVDIDDGITVDDATAYQALVQEDPTLRPLPDEEEDEADKPSDDRKMAYWCRSCRVTFKWRRHLEHHFLSHRTSERSSVCHVCGKCFTRGDHLNRHASMHNLTEYACQLCGQRFVRASHLEMHWESEHSRYIHHVPSVGRQTDGMSPTPVNTLLAENGLHLTSRHSQNNTYLYSRNHGNGDSLSDGSTSSPDHVFNGYETPTGSPTEPVPGQPGRLNGRVRSSPTSSEHGSFEITEEAINALSTVPIGCGPRPYRCQVCARAFNRLAHLQRHHRVHLGEKPLRCSLCSRSYSTAEQLRSHVITQHDNNVINCKTCGKEFSTMGALTNHQKVHQREQNRAESALITRSFVQQ